MFNQQSELMGPRAKDGQPVWQANPACGLDSSSHLGKMLTFLPEAAQACPVNAPKQSGIALQQGQQGALDQQQEKVEWDNELEQWGGIGHHHDKGLVAFG